MSFCPNQNLEDWAVFHAILIQSPTIKSCVRSIIISCFVWYSQEAEEHAEPFLCPLLHKNLEHSLPFHMIEEIRKRKISFVTSTLPLLVRLETVQINKGQFVEEDWSNFPMPAPMGIDSFFCQSSVTTLSLNSLKNVPISFISSILKLTQLNCLLLSDVYVEEDGFIQHSPLESRLTDLSTFGFELERTSKSDTSQIYEVAQLIIHSASQKLKTLTWFDPRKICESIFRP